ncbi:heme-binding protein [Neptuniibacter sp.]|uniref:GlcG/HbpS family heme-binding protein n=1 Tax=Neptuniibacter sp. TaxID=1962643 RepID=UPI00260ACB50|nr:heme-binding protein [Neptuniibacter sp.]MCP4597668.1 heme-binding protein [Neptuniibacter sp.]
MIISDKSLGWDAAQRAALAACQYAADNGLKICVWVLDRHGNPLAMQRINNAPMPSTEIARGKAFTAVSFGFGTHLWQERLADKPHLLSGLNVQEGVVMFGGGLPIEIDGERVGAIGVSGASEAQDQECAQAGINALTASK